MEKKNTMLLTVIAVATLLVAVVGATFAYFSLTVNSENGTTTANVSAGNIGAVTFTGGEKTLTLSVAAEDMAKPVSDRYYFATTTDKGKQTSGGHWVEGTTGNGKNDVAPEDGIHTIETVTLVGGEATDTYTCTGSTLEVTVAGTKGSDMLTALQEHQGWVALKLYGTLIGKTKEDPEIIDLSSVTPSGSEEPAKVDGITLSEIKLIPGSKTSMDLKAELYLVNSANDDQSVLAGKGLTVTITFTSSKAGGCTVAKTQS